VFNSKLKQTNLVFKHSIAERSISTRREFLAAGAAGLWLSAGAAASAQDEPASRPEPAPDVQLVPQLSTTPVGRDHPLYNFNLVSVKPLPKDPEGIWVLDFAFKPLRIKQIENPKRQQVHYLYYKVVNRTGAPRIFAPQFVMVNESGERFEEGLIPRIIPLIKAREDNSIPLLGAVSIMGTIPPSTKKNVDDAVFGVAVWDKWDPHADRFSIYVRGLSDGYKELPAKEPGKPPTVKYKTLRIDFIRRGDERNLSEREIQLNDPPYEWVYW
jgi:hypothetical protein